MSKERRIFTSTDFETTVREREAFGWVYVKQTKHTHTQRAYHAGGGTSLGDGFVGAGTTTYQTESFYEVEMYRLTDQPGYAELVAQEQRFFGEPYPKPVGGAFAKILHRYWTHGVALVPILLIAVLQFVPPAENWFQRTTADWSGDQLSIFALACLPLYGALLVATFRVSKRIEAPGRRRFERDVRRYEEVRQDALRKAAAVRGG